MLRRTSAPTNCAARAVCSCDALNDAQVEDAVLLQTPTSYYYLPFPSYPTCPDLVRFPLEQARAAKQAVARVVPRRRLT